MTLEELYMHIHHLMCDHPETRQMPVDVSLDDFGGSYHPMTGLFAFDHNGKIHDLVIFFNPKAEVQYDDNGRNVVVRQP
jgi:hypothetical protein